MSRSGSWIPRICRNSRLCSPRPVLALNCLRSMKRTVNAARDDSTHTRSRAAFSLIELLTVIAVIGILAALILATLSSAEKRARQIQCINNLRQLGIGLHDFVSDHHVYPLAFNVDYPTNYPEHYVSFLSAIGMGVFEEDARHNPGWWTNGVWHCPSAYRPTNFPKKRPFFRDYGYNGYGACKTNSPDPLGLGGHKGVPPPRPGFQSTAPPVNESEVVAPSDMIAVGDGFIGGDGTIRDGVALLWRTRWVNEDYSGSTKHAYSRHQGKANVVFCDGHAESPTLKSLFEDTGDEALSRWNRDHQPHRERLQ